LEEKIKTPGSPKKNKQNIFAVVEGIAPHACVTAEEGGAVTPHYAADAMCDVKIR
jgi:hypothetical protein